MTPSSIALVASACLLAALSAAACDEHRSVTLLFGPDANTLTAGFTCKDDSGNLLLARTQVGSNYTFQIVFDTFDLGDSLPGCRGEELLDACQQHGCTRVGRYCATVSVPTMNAAAILAALHSQLGDPAILVDAPSDPVIVRVATTTQSCTDLESTDPDTARLDPDQAVGCAYSCPVILSELHGSLGVALDTLDDQCSAEVHACAQLAKND